MNSFIVAFKNFPAVSKQRMLLVPSSAKMFSRAFSTDPSAKLSSTYKFNDLEPIDRKDNIIAVSELLLLWLLIFKRVINFSLYVVVGCRFGIMVTPTDTMVGNIRQFLAHLLSHRNHACLHVGGRSLCQAQSHYKLPL
jgi:hypothetical protein